MAKSKPKLYRAQFLITKPPKSKYEKITGISGVHFYLALNENDVKNHINETLEKIREKNNNDTLIYLKTLNIKQQKMDAIYNLIK